MSGRYYITTTTPYVNADPHIGFGLEIVAADVLARFHRLLGKEVAFNTGTDEHGQKIYQNALTANQEPQAYVDHFAAQFAKLQKLFNLSYTHFIRTTDAKHIKAAQTMWQLCLENGDIYKDHYQVKYCVGCELEKQDGELEKGRCPIHPNREIEIRDEENYFFRFSKYQQPLLDFYQRQPEFVKPASKMKEIVAFVEAGLKDFSISRLKEKMPWGVPVPNDDQHVMYVWFDALNVYISTLDWPEENSQFDKFWPAIQICGKDNLRQQSAMWQAMLMSAGLPNSKQILVNGFISVDGQKMSKSLGNVISPKEMVNRYGIDATRWLLMELGPIGTDMDVSWQKFNQTYNAQLANGLGNVCSRVVKLAARNQLVIKPPKAELHPLFVEALKNSDITNAFSWLNQQITQIDTFLSESKPWLLEDEEQSAAINRACLMILDVAFHLKVFMPTIAEQIQTHFTAQPIKELSPLFPRVE